ncbi:Zn(II)2Cys6 transcription factor [Aspergillus tanneri]|uniref:Zn(2)-C6 fungal-type domain-containing protein n=1 Tax=Aspergillus tanneri TaxID=1220188 RepID=A0A5M9MGR0_9EURO|nr:uncharacterized protein ATNIH1004_010453 [Aspergillus tanneri]KAA8643679.1 hypothetical protein ATNIH1004_010453 [Aspergillus tanneri]
MPRPRRPGAPEPKRRSRKGCWPCKARKIKCGEEKPFCLNCRRQNEQCDYSIRLNWGGRTRRRSSVDSPGSQSSGQSAPFSFALSPPDTQLDSVDAAQLSDSPGALEGSNGQGQNTENLFWESGFAKEMPRESSYPRGLHDIQEYPAVPDKTFKTPHCTHDKTSVEMSPLSSEAVPDYSSSMPQSLDNVPYPSPTDTGSSIGSFATLCFSPAAISQPISFLREPTGVSKQLVRHSLSDGGELSSHHDVCAQSSSTIDTADSYASYSTQSPSNLLEVFSPYLGKQRIFPPSGVEGNLADHPITSTEDFLSKIMNDPLQASDNSSYDHVGEDTSPYLEYACVHMKPNEPNCPTSSQRKWHTYLTSVTDNYGLDCGRPDWDLNQNDDHSAIDINYALDLIHPEGACLPASNLSGSQEKDVKQNSLDCTSCAYYKFPVPINIPRYLSPLPSTLVQNPINLMYFHHFLNHTARMLFPHDCGKNPFVSVLPSMAIGDSNLLNLMLAYSASHRARYLEHPEPANRIAHWVSSVFPTLRLALEDPDKKVTDNHLAAAIMLLSLKIVSPSTFEVPIPWQSHLKLARDLFLARRDQMTYSGNRVGAFLIRWLGYLDIMGTLSCRHSEPPLLEYHYSLNTCCMGDDYDEFCVDCFTGFTPRTGLFLTRLGKLVHRCDNEQFDETGAFVPGWAPSADIIFEAETLLADLDVLHMHVHANGKHFRNSMSMDIIAMDQAFRYAGLVHLHRRVLRTSPFSTLVKRAMDELWRALVLIRSGSSAEVGALFPLFTAGCESQDLEQRVEAQTHFEVLERTGLKQIQNARTLMQRCWTENLPWIALAQGEFLG